MRSFRYYLEILSISKIKSHLIKDEIFTESKHDGVLNRRDSITVGALRSKQIRSALVVVLGQIVSNSSDIWLSLGWPCGSDESVEVLECGLWILQQLDCARRHLLRLTLWFPSQQPLIHSPFRCPAVFDSMSMCLTRPIGSDHDNLLHAWFALWFYR